LADAAEVARALDPQHPIFLFSQEKLRSRARRFQLGFPGEVSYAVKCNPGAHVLSTLAAAGIGVFDVASVEEMEAVRAAAPEAELHYHNPVKSRRELRDAWERFGCRRYAVDDMQEIEKIEAITGGGKGIEIAVRFRLPRLGGSSAHDFSTKFGATREEAAVLLAEVAKRGMSPVLTFHPGSQCVDPVAYVRHIEAAARIATEAGVSLSKLNVGGGFPAPYAGWDVPELEVFFAAIAEAVEANFGASRPQLECEPGRGMVATSTSLLTRVKMVKPARGEVFLNDGIYGALMEIAQVPDIVPPHHVVRPEGGHRALRDFTIYGPTCDPLDRLPVAFPLPEDIAEDDFIEFRHTGAYGAATATRFNGYAPAAVVRVKDC